MIEGLALPGWPKKMGALEKMGIVTKLVLAVLPIWIVGCALESEIITGDDRGVTVKAASHDNPGPLADRHCAAYKKVAVLVEVIPVTVGGLTSVYNFRCDPKTE